ncbi:MAG TPA: shikimate kinase [Thermoplasmata archaeon]|jgi:shikimate kinase
MSGTARTFGAITITNALSTGIGCAAGIELPVEARVTLTTDGSKRPPMLEIPRDCHTAVVEEALKVGLSQYFPEPGAVARLALRSEIPVARGLKSSSAVSTAVLLAVARAADRNPTPLEIGRHSADVARRVGVSATGALDDALAGLEPGFVVTDNVRGEVLRRTDIDPGWGVALYIPSQRHPPSPNYVSAFSCERASGDLAARAAMDGDWTKAMRLNTELVERTMGYSYREVREHLRGHGAIASGVSGLGPTLATIAPLGRLRDLVRELPSDKAQKLVVPFTRTSLAGGGPP